MKCVIGYSIDENWIFLHRWNLSIDLIDQQLSWEATCHRIAKKFTRILCNLKFLYPAQMSPPTLIWSSRWTWPTTFHSISFITFRILVLTTPASYKRCLYNHHPTCIPRVPYAQLISPFFFGSLVKFWTSEVRGLLSTDIRKGIRFIRMYNLFTLRINTPSFKKTRAEFELLIVT